MGVNFHKGRQSAPHLGYVLLGLVTGVAEAIMVLIQLFKVKANQFSKM